MNAPAMSARKWARSDNTVKAKSPGKARLQRQTKNPYATPVGSGHLWLTKLKAAAVRCKHGSCRVLPPRTMSKYKGDLHPQLKCSVCLSKGIHQRTTYACQTCGIAVCIVPRNWGDNKSDISCADAAHQQSKINITNLTVMKLML